MGTGATENVGRQVQEEQPVHAQTNSKGFLSSEEGEDFTHHSALHLLLHIP